MAEKKLSRQRKYQLRMVSLGKCKICGKHQVNNHLDKLSGYCEFHLDMTRRITREYRRRKAKEKKDE